MASCTWENTVAIIFQFVKINSRKMKKTPGFENKPTKYSQCMPHENLWAYGVVVSMFDFHRSDWGSNLSRGSKIS